MFIADQITLETGFPAACARLGKLADGGLLLRASNYAYGEGITGLFRTGPVRCLPGAWGLAEVRLGELAVQDAGARLPLRWETSGPAGGRFPVLDADITLTAAGEDATVLALTGAYRVPSGVAAAGVDREVVRRCAAGTIRGFLARLACAVAHPAGWAERAAWPVSSAAASAGDSVDPRCGLPDRGIPAGVSRRRAGAQRSQSGRLDAEGGRDSDVIGASHALAESTRTFSAQDASALAYGCKGVACLAGTAKRSG